MFSSDFPRLFPDFRELCRPLENFVETLNIVSGGLLTVANPPDPSIHFGGNVSRQLIFFIRRVLTIDAWFFSGPGSGAPVHNHNYAILVQFYGSKRWIMYPRGHGYRSKVSVSCIPVSLSKSNRSFSSQVPSQEWLIDKIPKLQNHPSRGDVGA